MRICLLSLLALFAVGCASLNEQECAVSDWNLIGYEDGAAGYPASRVGDHRRACAKHGVVPDMTSYREGRNEGLREYCVASNGFNVGAGGGHYRGVCPAELEADFVAAFNDGHHLHTLRSRLRSANSSINSKRNAIEQNEDRVAQIAIEMVSDESTGAQRIALLAELREISEENGRLEAEIYELVDRRAAYEHELAEFEAMIAGVQSY